MGQIQNTLTGAIGSAVIAGIGYENRQQSLVHSTAGAIAEQKKAVSKAYEKSIKAKTDKAFEELQDITDSLVASKQNIDKQLARIDPRHREQLQLELQSKNAHLDQGYGDYVNKQTGEKEEGKWFEQQSNFKIGGKK